MKYSEKFFKIVMLEVDQVFEKERTFNNIELQNVLNNTIFNREGARVVSKISSDKTKFIWGKIFQGYSEIHSSVERLKNIEKYTRRFPYREMGVSEVDYLRYNIENYLSENYILRERMKTYNTKIIRAYKNSNNSEKITKEISECSKIITASFDSIVKIRGGHIHSCRYTDEELDRLSSLELLSASSAKYNYAFFFMYSKAYKDSRKKWVITMKRNLASIDSILEYFCKTLLTNITDGDRFIYPSNTSW